MSDMTKKLYPVTGMHCAVCAGNVEKIVRKQEGVENASVNLAAATLAVTYNPDIVSPQQLKEAVMKIGFDLIIDEDNSVQEQEEAEQSYYGQLKRKTIVAWIFALPVAVLGMFLMNVPGVNWWMLLLLLEPYTDGELSFLLNATENVDIVHDRLIAFDMEDASKKEYFPLVAIITLQMIVDKIKKRQGFAKELIIDEALDFLQDEKFGDFIAYLYRTFRKKEGSITLAAQNILFLKNMPSSIKDSIIINCATKIILDHSEHRQNLPEVKAVLSITDEEAYMIESLQRTERWREFFIKMSNDAFIFRNEVSDFAAVAFDSRQATVVRLKQLFNESGSTYTAINRYLEERRKKYG